MIRLTQKLTEKVPENATLTLTQAEREKSRLRTKLDDGRDVGLFPERGKTLQNGDLLADENGMVVKIIAAKEKISCVTCEDPLLLMRAGYHLGNRHVPLQINKDRLQYLHDKVLDDMIKNLGLSVEIIEAPFEPEPGAYAVSHSHHH